MVMVNVVQAFDAVIADDVWVTETTSAEAFSGSIKSVVAARRVYEANLIEEYPFTKPICYGS
jgi:hypothetical protein